MSQNIERRFNLVNHSKTFNNIVQTYALGTKEVFDVGCSYGEFLIHFGKGSVGITVTEAEVAYGKEKGLDVRLGNVESDTFALEKKFDVIFANNIFEHLYSPHHFLIKSKKFLKDDGMLILGVPCIPKIVSLLHVPKFRGSLAIEHINFFTKDTLTKTVERGGWVVKAVRGFHFYNPYIDTLPNMVYPHFFVVATPNPQFAYHERRLKELVGYVGLIEDIPMQK